ncbi:MAG: AMP-binding protein [Xanthomonadales bacterium]|nr:AMP-binding protein [Xanthomonadales bacterium]NIN59654.1 AMP-binding protein [Xanthomonadales bacterium]NIN75067.1 AMP-binding protein [Xanthomonadales bacterium]NIO13401.1 AMP-binding protein [Xanthomonadales bacterium]NIP12047.1 AMP-binding protein [Xanthomonadales bacterium]
MMNKPWLQSYPPGVPEHIDLGQYHSLLEILDESCAKYRERIAFTCMGSDLTYFDLDRMSRNFAAVLQDKGLRPGDRVAIMMPNILQYPIAIWGILRAGLTVVNTNPMYTARELRHQLVDAGVRAIVVVENFAHVLEQVRDEVPVEHVFTTGVGDMLAPLKGTLVNFLLRHVRKAIPAWDLPGAERFRAALANGEQLSFTTPIVGPEDIAFLQYTGGTTGVAKGAMLTHRNLVANLLQSRAWLTELESGHELIVTALPLYHIFALTANCLVFMLEGGRNLLITDPRNSRAFVKELSRYPFTGLTGVNTMFNNLLNTEGFAELDFSQLKLTLAGGMALQRAVADQWKAVTGAPIIEAYGLTETSPAACINPMTLKEYNGYIGLPIPSTECAIMDSKGEPLPAGEIGELCIRGPQVMKGYWHRPEDTAEVLEPDGWLHTGDIATMTPDGYFKIVDRKKDMIIVSGFNVFPNEIEDVVVQHPKVLEAAVIGVPDDRSGEAVKLCVVKREESLSEEELRAFCRENLTGYKRPKLIEFFDELPKSNVGKILRKDLRAAHAA